MSSEVVISNWITEHDSLTRRAKVFLGMVPTKEPSTCGSKIKGYAVFWHEKLGMLILQARREGGQVTQVDER